MHRNSDDHLLDPLAVEGDGVRDLHIDCDQPCGDRKHKCRIAARENPWHDHLTGIAQLGPSVALENDDDGVWPDRGHPIESHQITGQLGTKPAAECRPFTRRLSLPPRRLNLG
jgi:hypothetical protein